MDIAIPNRRTTSPEIFDETTKSDIESRRINHPSQSRSTMAVIYDSITVRR